MDRSNYSNIDPNTEHLQRQAMRILPVRFSVSEIRSMSDEEIMSILSGEVDINGTLYHDTLNLLSTELNRREVQRASKPHWTTVPGFVLTAIAALASVVAAIAAVVVLLKEPQPLYLHTVSEPQSVSEESSTQ